MSTLRTANVVAVLLHGQDTFAAVAPGSFVIMDDLAICDTIPGLETVFSFQSEQDGGQEHLYQGNALIQENGSSGPRLARFRHASDLSRIFYVPLRSITALQCAEVEDWATPLPVESAVDLSVDRPHLLNKG